VGKAGNKQRAESRRAREARATAKNYLKELVANDQEERAANVNLQEQIELDRAYASSIGDAADRGTGTAIVPWEALEDPADTQGSFIMADPNETNEPTIDNLVPLTEKWRVLLEEDHIFAYPELGFEVYVAGNLQEELPFIEMFSRAGCRRAATLDDADLCIFVGSSSDVDPQLYGHGTHPNTNVDPVRDQMNMEIYSYCLTAGIPMFGVCHGAQFLHVMNGGILYQDVDGHVGDHSIRDLINHRTITKTPSVHHQMCVVNPLHGMQVLATSPMAKRRLIWDDREGHNEFKTILGIRSDVEAFFYRDTCCLGVQGHPEYSRYPEYTTWCLNMLEQFIRHNPDLEWDENVLRLKPEFIEERDARFVVRKQEEKK
jgi:gamma-glutamyl-gamma-aminobutyrate hydrolase PuuD